MSEVKWIKLAVDLFDNRKIKQIRKLPEGAEICLMWVQLLCLAGAINDGGRVYITEEIPYTEDTLATELDMPLQTVKLGLKVFGQFGMIETTDNGLRLASWEKYQSVEKLDKYKEYQRQYHRQYRAKQKALETQKDSGVNLPVNLRKLDVNGTDKDKDIDIDKDLDLEVDNKPKRHRYGEYKNVLLSDEELRKLQNEFPDYNERIERLSEYIAQTGRTYKSHLATIRSWARRENSKTQPQARKGNYFQQTVRSMSYDEYYAATAGNAVDVDDEDDEFFDFTGGQHNDNG